MSGPSDGYRVGYGRPPQETRWKKAHSGNPRRKKLKRLRTTVEIIDGMLFAPVQVTLNGETLKVPTIKAIILQLMQKGTSGNVRAARILQKYLEFANSNLETKPELAFVESEYTCAFTQHTAGNDDA